MDYECGLSTEELLFETPVELVRRPQPNEYFHRYEAVRISDGETVGGTNIAHWTHGKELNNPYVLRSYLGQGYGLAIYVAANRIHLSEEEPLQSQRVFISNKAKRVWESLVRREIAFVKDPDYLQYQFESIDI